MSFLIVFLPVGASNLTKSLETLAATRNITGTETWPEDTLVSDNIVVPYGATLVIKKGVTVSFTNHASIIIYGGELIVGGTVKDPVKFKAADSTGVGYSIFASNQGKITMRNADIRDGGANIAQVYEKNRFTNQAFAAEYKGALQIDNGKLEVQSSNFHDNANAISIKNSSASNIRVNRSRFSDNFNYNVVSSFYSGNLPDFKFNWWGRPDGPQPVCVGCAVYSGILGQINFSNWLTSEIFRDPVIIIPGIMGSWEVDGEWKLDPILHSYDNIYNKLIQEGYTPNVDLFKFPYQWRNSNIQNAQFLAEAISVVKAANHNWPKVDLIAHSMGGLLARQYIESDGYNFTNDVDQLITVGTPHKGAPKVYPMWEAGEFTDLFGFIGKLILTREAKKAGYDSLFHYIRNIPNLREHPMQSVQELLPQYNYIFDLDLNAPRIYTTGSPQNVFLNDLNSEAKLKNMLKVENDIIYGKVDDENTISAFEVIHAPAFGDYWADGYPKNYYSLFWGEEGVIYGEGDETVPVSSATGIDADYKIPINASHNHLTTEAQSDIVELLTGAEPKTEKVGSAGTSIRDILLIQVYCPVDIQVVDPDRNVFGKNQNNPPDITYVNNSDDEEFITIPNPKDGEYKVVATGTGNGGEYEIEVAKITEDQSSLQLARETKTILSGVSAPGDSEEKIFKIDNGRIMPSDTTPPVITITFPEDQKTYFNDQYNLPVEYTITDETSPAEKIEKTIIYDGAEFSENEIDLSLQKLGGHTFKISAVDEAGNQSEQISTFQISTNISAIRKNLDHYWNLGLIKKKIACRYFSRKLKNLEKLFNLLEKIKNSKLKPKQKQIAIEALKRIINADIDRIIRQIKRRSPRWIDAKAAQLLMESLNAIKIK